MSAEWTGNNIYCCDCGEWMGTARPEEPAPDYCAECEAWHAECREFNAAQEDA